MEWGVLTLVESDSWTHAAVDGWCRASKSTGVHTQRRVPPLAVVEDLEVLEDGARQLDASHPALPVGRVGLVDGYDRIRPRGRRAGVHVWDPARGHAGGGGPASLARAVVGSCVRAAAGLGGTSVIFDITSAEAGSTSLRFRHIGLMQLECVDVCTVAWPHYLRSLVAYVDHGVGFPGPRSER